MKKWIIISMIYILAICLMYGYDANRIVEIVSVQQTEQDKPLGEITDGKVVSQEFTAKYDNISSIDLMFATYNRKNSGKLIFDLKENNQFGKILFSQNIDIASIKDNADFKFNLNKVKVSKGEKLCLTIEAPDSKNGNAITLWYNSKADNGTLFIDNKNIDGTLRFSVNTMKKKGLEF